MKPHSKILEAKKTQKLTGIYLSVNVRIFVFYLLLLFCNNTAAQSGLLIYTDMGRTNVSQGLFIKSAAIGYFNVGKNIIGTGFQLDLKDCNGSCLSGITFNVTRKFMIKKIPIELHRFFIRTYYSKIIGEINSGAFLKTRVNHLELMIGTSFRTYSFKGMADADYNSDNINTKFHENFNLIYSFSYYLKPPDEKWNVGLSLTDMDDFIINQDTNPVFSVKGLYRFTPSLSLNAELWYKTAGALNLKINHFGYFIRTSIIWNFN